MNRPKDLNSPSRWNMRIWDNEKNEWLGASDNDVLTYYGFDIRGGEVTAFQGIDWIYKQHKRWNDFIWERSTGLTDKNGKEIYEGDIVKYADYQLTIQWQEATASTIGKYHEGYFYLNSGRSEAYEVIGTIHENPELLEG